MSEAPTRGLRLAAAVMALCAAVLLTAALAGGGLPPGKKGGAAARRPARPSAPRRAHPPADNSYCLVCHANFKAEALARQHQAAGVGCDRCHGPSDRHSSDENNVTPPDIMFPRAKIAGACTACHSTQALRKADARRRSAIHAPFLSARAPAPRQVCTDCHGAHRLPVRTRRWDRSTGKLLSDDGVRMIDDGSQRRKPEGPGRAR